MAEATTETGKLAPPYVSFKTFKGFIETLSEIAVPPNKIDRSVMTKMSGIAQSQTMTALKFLGLTGPDGTAMPQLRVLVKSYGTEQWAETLTEVIFDAYTDIMDGLDLEGGTASQLKTSFNKKGHLDGQLLVKAIRFWLKAVSETRSTVSPYFKAPPMPTLQNSTGTGSAPKKLAKEKTTPKTRHDKHTDTDAPQGMTLVPLGKERFMHLPIDLTDADCDAIEASMPLLRTIAKLPKGGQSK